MDHEYNPATRYAGIVSRGAALAIDISIFAVLSTLTALFLQALGSFISTKPFGDVTVPAGLTAAAITVLLTVYFTGAWAITGRTVGEALLGLRVTRTDGRRVKLVRAFLRFLCLFLLFVCFGLGFFWMLIDRRRRTWMDLVARTVVLYDFDSHGVHHHTEIDTPDPSAVDA